MLPIPPIFGNAPARLFPAQAGQGNSSELAFLHALGLLQAHAYLAARQAASALTLAEPTNPRAEALLELWKERAVAEGWQALRVTGIALGVAALLGLACYALWPRSGGVERGASRTGARGGRGSSGGAAQSRSATRTGPAGSARP